MTTCEYRFKRLKQLLTIAPFLKVFDPFGDFLICMDACKEGLGGVLMHNGHVISYESRKLKDHEINYDVHD
jgi:predicted transcriptional regulator